MRTLIISTCLAATAFAELRCWQTQFGTARTESRVVKRVPVCVTYASLPFDYLATRVQYAHHLHPAKSFEFGAGIIRRVRLEQTQAPLSLSTAGDQQTENGGAGQDY